MRIASTTELFFGTASCLIAAITRQIFPGILQTLRCTCHASRQCHGHWGNWACAANGRVVILSSHSGYGQRAHGSHASVRSSGFPHHALECSLGGGGFGQPAGGGSRREVMSHVLAPALWFHSEPRLRCPRGAGSDSGIFLSIAPTSGSWWGRSASRALP